MQNVVTKPTIPIPAAPAHLPEAAKKQWNDLYAKALAQAKLDIPNNEPAQRSAALKAANAMLAVPAPTSAAEIDKLQDWQVMSRNTRIINGVTMRTCITADGRKYKFPLPQAEVKQASVVLEKLSKDELIDPASSVHGLTLNASSTKAEMINQISAHIEATK